MCSPFVLLVSRRYAPQQASRTAVLGAQLWYTAGRVVTYGLLGTLAGLAGGAVELAGSILGLQRAASVVAGLFLVIQAVVALAGAGTGAGAGAGGKLFGRVTAAIGRRIPGHPFGLGLFLGLLPCGLLYSAVIAAMARGGPLQGAVALLLFGLGTAPRSSGSRSPTRCSPGTGAAEPPRAGLRPGHGRVVRLERPAGLTSSSRSSPVESPTPPEATRRSGPCVACAPVVRARSRPPAPGGRALGAKRE